MMIFDIAIINDTKHVHDNLSYTLKKNYQFILYNPTT